MTDPKIVALLGRLVVIGSCNQKLIHMLRNNEGTSEDWDKLMEQEDQYLEESYDLIRKIVEGDATNVE